MTEGLLMWKILADFLLIILFAMNKRALSQYLYTASASFVHSASIFPIPYDVKIAPTVDKLNFIIVGQGFAPVEKKEYYKTPRKS